MSLIDKLLGRRAGDPYAEGLSRYEAGRYAEAADWLRTAEREQRRGVSGSLAAFFLRQALTLEGRRLLRAGQPAAARPFLQEAAATWSGFPDLHCLLGMAQALEGDFGAALGSAVAALRANPDYAEARLLEAAVLAQLGRRAEAAASLDKLLESARRIDHHLIAELARSGGYDAATLPGDLLERVRRTAEAGSEDFELAEAVALCRAGRWQEGMARLREICGRRPDYPDYQLKLAAACYQNGQNEEALAAADRALAVNPGYRAAAQLKALVLAEGGRLMQARSLLSEHPALAGPARGQPHEELFTDYLRAALDLLTGRADACLARLEEWNDLTQAFPRGALLAAAAEAMLGREGAAARRLAQLAAAWPGDPDFAAVHVHFLLRQGALEKAARALAAWPGGTPNADHRPLLLSACLALAEGRAPDLEPLAAVSELARARLYLAARGHAVRGRWALCRDAAAQLWREGGATERVALLAAAAAAALDDADAAPAWRDVPPLAESLAPYAICAARRAGNQAEAEAVRCLHQELHGDDPRWTWLSPLHWLAPIRAWLG